MKRETWRVRGIYGLLFLLILITEILIALFVNDAFIRPYGGDILVTVLLCCLLRIFVPHKCRLLPLWVFLFSVAVEAAQYINIVSLLGLDGIPFFRILVGTTFSFADILCYFAGCAVFFLAETVLRKR